MKTKKIAYTIEYKGRELVRIYDNPDYTYGYSYTLFSEGYGVHHAISPRKLAAVLAKAKKNSGTVYFW